MIVIMRMVEIIMIVILTKMVVMIVIMRMGGDY